MVHDSSFSCPFGTAVIGCKDQAVVSIRISHDSCSDTQTSPVSQLAVLELAEYFAGTRKHFDFPMKLSGTPFQLAVWYALMQIPYGQTRTYGQIAASIGKPKAARAVGRACNCNPIWIAVPCHRVLGRNDALTGYAGGLDMKRALLELERTNL